MIDPHPGSAVASSPVAARPAYPTVLDALEAAAAGGGPYVTFHGAGGERALDFRAALDGARRWGALLARRGVVRGDRVAILLPTGPSFVTALLGTMLAGAVPVPLAAPLTFGKLDRYLSNLARILTSAGARVLVTYPRIREAAREMVGRPDPLDVVTDAELDGLGSARGPRVSIGAGDTALLQYTSGTTGDPKGAVISHRALTSNAFAIAHGLGLRPDDVGVSWLPLFHDMGLIGVVITALCHPYPVHVMSPESFVMRPNRWLETMARVGGTISCAPNFGYELAAKHAAGFESDRALPLDRVRVLLNGAEPVRAATIERFLGGFGARGLAPDVMLPVYGMAESTLAVTFPRLPRKLEVLAASDAPHGAEAISVGAPVAGASLAITDERGHTVAERVLGEIRVSGASLMDGYFRNERATAEVLSDGWLRTGDVGFLDAGRLFITGRAKEIIIQAGRNVHAPDVERVAFEACGPRAAAIAAFARPSAERGTDDLVVLVETSEKDAERRASMVTQVKGEVLAALSVRVDDVRLCAIGTAPRTTSGKLRRNACAELFPQGLT